MGLERSLDALTWRGALRGSAKHGLPWAVIGAQLGLLLGIVAGTYAPIGPELPAHAILALISALAGGAVGWSATGAMAPVDAMVRIDGSGITLTPLDPLPWELFAAWRAWPGEWRESRAHLTWEEVQHFGLDPSGMAVIQLTHGLGGRPRVVAFRLMYVHEEERRAIAEAVAGQRLLADMEGPHAPPEALVQQRQSPRRIRWRQSFASFRRLRLSAPRPREPEPVETEAMREHLTQLRMRVHKERDRS